MKRKILFFIKGSCPTEAEREAAKEIDGAVFRNATFAGSEVPESCDGVAGCVPSNYMGFDFVGNIDEAAQASKPKAKPGRKKKEEHERDGLQLDDEELPVQTPLIPAETGWTANS